MKYTVITIKGGDELQRQNFANLVGKKHKLDDRPFHSFDNYSQVRTYRPTKVVKNVIKKVKKKLNGLQIEVKAS